jgi:hypothetical protein
MTVQATITITLGICGPFLCSGTAPVSWGFDATFDRDYLGCPYIDRSHIKGKLREAMKEIGTSDNHLNEWFGKEGPMENGSLFFSDLRLKETELEEKLTKIPSEDKLHRIAMDTVRHVVKPNALQVMENAFPGGRNASGEEKSYIWAGTISYIALTDTDANNIHKEIQLGLKWMTRLGAEKGIGFGRLKSVDAELMEPKAIELIHSPAAKASPQFTLSITTDDVLMLGDIRIKESNYQESIEYITGNAIKGALAQALNMACGVCPVTKPIDVENKAINNEKAFPLLAKYFSAIRITHAYPSLTEKRPVVIPYSVVVAGEKHYDIALKKDAILPGGNLPAFQTDWKDEDYPNGFGWATPRRFAKTRTAIDDVSRRADDGHMFVYQYVCPKNEDQKDISWIGGVYLDDIPANDLPALQSELKCAFGLLKYLGKRAGRVTVDIKQEAPKPFKTIQPLPESDTVIISLQSDAMMVNPEDLLKNGQTAGQLLTLYNAYWEEVSDKVFTLSHFFAMQKIRGNFIRRKKDESSPYYPYYLTEAGSVFVLTVKDKGKAQKLFAEWEKTGLREPAWAKHKYGDPLWIKCPYVRENGFGEVIINADLGLEKINEGGTGK